MWRNQGIVERWALAGANYIRNNGGHPDVSVATMRYSLQLWISMILIIALSLTTGLIIGTALPTMVALVAVATLRYFSGGWHLRTMDACVLFTTAVVTVIPLIPTFSSVWLLAMNGISLVLVVILAPTGHGQKFKSTAQRNAFKWIAICIVLINFFTLFQIVTLAILCQSLSLITLKGGEHYET